jgi:acetoin utilization deacetylase AcuC-like enzyme
MMPWRVKLTHGLVGAFGLDEHMDVLQAVDAHPEQYKLYHSDVYINALTSIVKGIQPAAKYNIGVLLKEKGLEEDQWYPENPIFIGMTKYIAKYTGASLAAAATVSQGHHDIAINWSGGMHHAMKGNAFGFCYVNDCVLAIKHLLHTYGRVLYVDIDLQ